ncbi:energy-coupling factor transporter ATPase [uncultured Dialister sp.]|uniref:energy-coupling factor transporter ATPase n=1 Tax=uncultured Dialister sp. TaxID=278064 RepID=UPI0025E5A129|nr:energy-coupling factor transporter ATPase [uncultured Dialister sp.]
MDTEPVKDEKQGGEILFDIRHLTHTFETEEGKKFDALSDVTATIKKGSFTAIIGTNGSGKSTLARHLNALLIPTDGEIYVEGMKTSDFSHIWDIRQKVGMVFQNPDNQLVAAIVEEDVAFGPENIGVPPDEIRKRVDVALEKVGMTAYRTHSPAMLSGGQKQRVAIAGILAMHPDCIVLDEPTAMLDPKGRKEVMDTVHDLNENEGITIVLITHFMEEAVTADHVMVIDKGHLRMEGTAREVFSQAEKLRALGLDVPVAADLAYGLRKKGFTIPEDCLTDEELGEALCPYVSKM